MATQLSHSSTHYDQQPKPDDFNSKVINNDKNPGNLITKEELIAKFGLKTHPEGGYYHETYRSEQGISAEGDEQGKRRIASTGIYFLIGRQDKSLFHRIKSDEMWHFYLGKPLVVVELDDETKSYRETVLGNNFFKNEVVQYVVKKNTWFGAYLITNEEYLSKVGREDAEKARHDIVESQDFRLVTEEHFEYAFVGCTVAPGFEFDDFELAERNDLIEAYPNAIDKIRFLTKEKTAHHGGRHDKK